MSKLGSSFAFARFDTAIASMLVVGLSIAACNAVSGVSDYAFDAGAGGAGTSASSTGGSCTTANCTTEDPCKKAECVASTCKVSDATSGKVCTDGGTVCLEGKCVACIKDDDCPVPSGICTAATCTPDHKCQGGVAAVGAPCGVGLTCDDQGDCTGCASATDCGMPPACQEFACSSNHVCTLSNSTSETTCPTGKCNGTGMCVACVSDGDCPAPADCKSVACSAEECVTSNLAVGTTCPTGVCDASGNCVACVTSACPVCTACQPDTCSPLSAGAQDTGRCDNTAGCGNEKCACDGLGNCRFKNDQACIKNEDCASGNCICGTNCKCQ